MNNFETVCPSVEKAQDTRTKFEVLAWEIEKKYEHTKEDALEKLATMNFVAVRKVLKYLGKKIFDTKILLSVAKNTKFP